MTIVMHYLLISLFIFIGLIFSQIIDIETFSIAPGKYKLLACIILLFIIGSRSEESIKEQFKNSIRLRGWTELSLYVSHLAEICIGAWVYKGIFYNKINIFLLLLFYNTYLQL